MNIIVKIRSEVSVKWVGPMTYSTLTRLWIFVT